MSKAIQELTSLVAEFPGLGPRQARRVVEYLLRASPQYKKKLTESILTLNNHIAQCASCYRFAEVNQHGICSICADTNRDQTTLMVVEKDVDLEGMEAVALYSGQYLILGSLLSLTGRRKKSLDPRTDALLKRINNIEIKEVILAFATTPDGDYTARELKTKILETQSQDPKRPPTKISILGRGLSLGAEIEYADSETLRSAFQGRREEF